MNETCTPSSTLHAAVDDINQPVSINSVIIGCLLGFDAEGRPLVAFPGNLCERALPARCTVQPSHTDLGKEVALVFEQGDPERPMLIGVIQQPQPRRPDPTVAWSLDDQRLVLSAEREVVLRCGDASITLTRAGKILIKGAYVSNRSSGMQRMSGASVEIN